MTMQGWTSLAILSVKSPATAARLLLAMEFPVGALWTALVLVAIGNTFLFALSETITEGPSPISGVLNAPLVFFLVAAGSLAAISLSVLWVGRWMGGMGSLADILMVVTWMQVLRLVIQIPILVLMFISPVLSALLVLAAALIGVFMLVHFVDQAHHFNSPGKAILVLIMSLLAIVFGLSIIHILVGGPFVGSSQIV